MPRYDNNNHNRREAARFINMGYRVTDDYGRDLAIETRPDGTRRIVIGADLLATHYEGIYATAEAGARQTDDGRPRNLPSRPLTDYEAGKPYLTFCPLLLIEEILTL